MGRRSISSTKTGKFMNPTDQARKEARRKELKKNKKQRQLVRQAVLKSKDPTHLLTEIEALDRMEFDPNNPPPYNVKVIQDKRKKLRETWQKVFRYYEREDPKFASELRGLELEYEKKKSQIMGIYESVKKAEHVKLDEIPLPDAPSNQAALAHYQANEIPLPLTMPQITTQKGILKKIDQNGKHKPPGPPPGPPPPLTEFECDDDEKELGMTADDNLKNVLSKAKKIRFSDEPSSKTTVPPLPTSTIAKPQYPPVPPSSSYAAALKQNIPPPPLPPQSAYPTGKPAVNAYGSAIPPNAALQRMPQMHPPLPPSTQKYPAQGAVLMAAPTRNTAAANISYDDRGASATTIEAKPILRNKMAEITRFVPTSLIVRRDPKTKTSGRSDDTFPSYMQQSYSQPYASSQPQHTNQKASTDTAYEQFMKEMEKLL